MERKISISGLQQKKLFPLIIHSMLIQIKTFTIIKKFKEKKLKTIEAIIDKCFVQTTFFSLFDQNFDNSRNCNKRAKNKLLRSFPILSENLSKRIHIWEIVTFENLNLIGSWLENETGREICHKFSSNDGITLCTRKEWSYRCYSNWLMMM